jgi:UDP-N-acetyl-D-glucosamine dehydrogenase
MRGNDGGREFMSTAIAGFDVAVVGLGYVGMSLVHRASVAGLRVAGLDVRQDVVDGLRAGRSHVDDVSGDDLQAINAAGFVASADPEVLAEAAVVAICVPTPLTADGGPDLSAVCAAAGTVGRYLRPGILVILESTSHPGTTDEVVRPILETTSSLRAGRDFALAFSPERIDPGNRRFNLETTPKIVGGHSPACAAAAAGFYQRFVQTVVRAKGTREAELAKIIENTYRNVNIALVNEIARLAHDLGIDVWDALHCAATKPFGFQPFYPGPGPGGHCIPVDPGYFSYLVRANGGAFRLLDVAQEVNRGMPRYVVERASLQLNRRRKSVNGSGILLLGVTYKPNVSDQRGAASWEVAGRLLAMGAALSYHDPYVPKWEVAGVTIPRQQDLVAALREADLTILLQDHAAYDPQTLTTSAGLLFDACGCTRGFAGENVEVL